MARAAAAVGDLQRARSLAERAEAFAQTIAYPQRRMAMLSAVVAAMAAAGDLQRAEALAHAVPSPYERAETIAALAAVTELNHSRSLIAQALATGHWRASLFTLAKLEPDALSIIIDDQGDGICLQIA